MLKAKNRVLRVVLSGMLILAMACSATGMIAFAANTTRFVDEAYANNWAFSDARAYMNSGLSSSNSLNNKVPLRTSTTAGTSIFERDHFTAGQLGVVKQSTVSTYDQLAKTFYDTTDRFYLPSGNSATGNNQILYWGKNDVVLNADFEHAIINKGDINRVIPMGYFPRNVENNNRYNWLRSAYGNDNEHMLISARGDYVTDTDVNSNSPSLAAVTRLDINSVSFASGAEAVSLSRVNGSRMAIDSTNLGVKNSGELNAEYGLFLKTQDTRTFTPSRGTNFISNNGNRMTINYTGGIRNAYVVVCAYNDLNATGNGTVYMAARRIESTGNITNNSFNVNISDWNLANNNSLNGYSFKVWMETPATGTQAFASATTPVELGTARANIRAYASKADLQCSWGDVSNSANLLSAAANNNVAGAGATNQILYFGTSAYDEDDDGWFEDMFDFWEDRGWYDGDDDYFVPMKWWICGREDSSGNLSASGNTLVIFQMEALCDQEFNRSDNDYNRNTSNGGMNINGTLNLSNQTVAYTGSPAVYPANQILYTRDPFPTPSGNPFVPSGAVNYSWFYRLNNGASTGWTAGMPTAVGVYTIKAEAGETTENARVGSNLILFTITTVNPELGQVGPFSATYGDTLADITIPSSDIGTLNWNVATSTSVGNVGANNFAMSFTPDDPLTHNALNNIPVIVNVSPKSLEVKADDKSKLVGEALPIFTFTVDENDLVNGDSASVVTGTAIFGCAATADSPADNYAIEITDGLTASNYTISYAQGTLTVTQDTITTDHYQVSGTLGDNGWYIGDATISSLSLNGYDMFFVNGQPQSSIVLDASGGDQSISFAMVNSTSGALTTATTVSLDIDKVTPALQLSGVPNKDVPNFNLIIGSTAGSSGIRSIIVSGAASGSVQNGRFNITQNGTYIFTITNEAGITSQESITISNIKPYTNPDTGVTGGIAITVAIMAAAAGALILTRKKRYIK